jgi:nitroimidazol reductase NimA-like FMN-containing flavoprotein (pyridoxamine 5'-phosphate oxidase superfamily)
MTEFETTTQSRVRQIGGRGRYDRETVYAILDEAPVCHVAFEVDGQPYAIPSLWAKRSNPQDA